MVLILQARDIPPDLLEFFEPINTGAPTDVLSLSSESFPGAHFATFPTEIPRRAILAGTSERGCCPKCGAAWVRVVDSLGPNKPNAHKRKDKAIDVPGSPMFRNGTGHSGLSEARMGSRWIHETKGWQPGCTCNAGEPVPCVVLDPFAGACTTGLVASRLGRDAILIELSPSYAEMGRARIENDCPMFSDVAVDSQDNTNGNKSENPQMENRHESESRNGHNSYASTLRMF